jgi:hypothetical protein
MSLFSFGGGPGGATNDEPLHLRSSIPLVDAGLGEIGTIDTLFALPLKDWRPLKRQIQVTDEAVKRQAAGRSISNCRLSEQIRVPDVLKP